MWAARLEEWTAPGGLADFLRRLDAECLAFNLTRLAAHVLVKLATRLADGDTPSDDELAADAGCSARHVRRVRVQAAKLGLLVWDKTRRVIAGMWRQGRNLYRAIVPETPPSPDGQAGRARRSDRKKEAGKGAVIPIPASVAIASLAETARVRAAKLAADEIARRQGSLKLRC